MAKKKSAKKSKPKTTTRARAAVAKKKPRASAARAKKSASRAKPKPAARKVAKKVAKKATKKAKPVARKPVARKPIVAAKAPPPKKAKRAAPKKAAAPKPVAKPVPKVIPTPIHRRDGAGHLDPKYAADLLAQSGGHDDGDDRAFLKRGNHSKDDLAEELGEEFVKSATSGEADGEDSLNQVVEEETGGPFVSSTGGTEFAEGTDASNPASAEREPFPKT